MKLTDKKMIYREKTEIIQKNITFTELREPLLENIKDSTQRD